MSLYQANLDRAAIEAKAQPVLEFLSGLSTISMLSYRAFLVMSGRITVGLLFAFYSLTWEPNLAHQDAGMAREHGRAGAGRGSKALRACWMPYPR